MGAVGVALGAVIGVGLLIVFVRPPQAATSQVADRTAPVTRRSNLAARLMTLFGEKLAQAGWSDVSAPAVAVLWGVGSVMVGALVWWLVPLAALGPLATVAVLLGGVGVLRARIEARQRALRAVWPQLVDHLRQAVRSGAGVGEAVWALGDVSPSDLQPAFTSYRHSLEAGQPVSACLVRLKTDIANPVADRIIEALRMAHEVGGPELPRILADLQSSVRADWQVREDALAKQAWIRAASKLGVAAPWIVLVLISGRHETQTSYSTPVGMILLLAGAVVSGFAFQLMQKLGSLPPEKRWLA